MWGKGCLREREGKTYDEGIVEGGVDVRDAENELTRTEVLRTEGLLLLGSTLFAFLGLHIKYKLWREKGQKVEELRKTA